MGDEPVSRGAIALVNENHEDGPPFHGLVLTGWHYNEDDEVVGGRKLSICKHSHREFWSAEACARRLFRRRCPAIDRRERPRGTE